MNKIVTFLFLGISLPAYSQKIIKNEIDEFTNASIIETDYNPINADFKWQTQIQGTRIDSSVFFKLAISIGANKVFSVDQGNHFMLKLSNDSVIILKPQSSAVASRGGLKHGKMSGSNAIGVNVTYHLTSDDILKLSNYTIKKIRIYTSDSYLEKDATESTNEIIGKTLRLITKRKS